MEMDWITVTIIVVGYNLQRWFIKVHYGVWQVKKLQRQLDEEKEQRQTAEKMASARASKAAATSNGTVEIEHATEG